MNTRPDIPRRPAFATWLSTTNDITSGFLSAAGVPGLINMAGGLPAPETFPVGELTDLAAAAVRDHAGEVLAYGPVPGLPVFRDLIAQRFSRGRLTLTRENVLITTSGLQALDLLGKVLIEQGGLIAAQFPTYLGALDAWRPRMPSIRPFQLEDNAFDAVETLTGAQFAYTLPNFSNPTGRLVGLGQRQTLVDAAMATGTWLVEDDPYGTLHYDGDPVPRLLDLAANEGPYDGPVIYVGTLSKEITPGLRIGWVIATPDMITALVAAKQGSDMCTSGVTQRIAHDAFATGLVERTTPIIISLYKSRRDALVGSLNRHLTPWMDWDVPVGGMFIWATARDAAVDTDKLATAALRHGVCVTPSSVFDPTGRNRRSIRINFTLNPPEKLEEGCRRLAVALQEVAPIPASG